jgi:hypothetical protein
MLLSIEIGGVPQGEGCGDEIQYLATASLKHAGSAVQMVGAVGRT